MKSSRLPALFAVLAATAALAAYDGGRSEVDAPRAADMPRLPAIRALATRTGLSRPPGDPFATPVAAVAVPVPDAVPPAATFSDAMPWRVIGKQHAEGEGWTVFLARGAETWVVREGDDLDDGHRVLAIHPPRLTLLNAKNKTRRILDIGDPQE